MDRNEEHDGRNIFERKMRSSNLDLKFGVSILYHSRAVRLTTESES